jgi:hypothetical protein
VRATALVLAHERVGDEMEEHVREQAARLSRRLLGRTLKKKNVCSRQTQSSC